MSYFVLNAMPSKVILRQYDLLQHIKQDKTLIIICHYSVCLIYDLSYLITDHCVSYLKKNC